MWAYMRTRRRSVGNTWCFRWTGHNYRVRSYHRHVWHCLILWSVLFYVLSNVCSCGLVFFWGLHRRSSDRIHFHSWTQINLFYPQRFIWKNYVCVKPSSCIFLQPLRPLLLKVLSAIHVPKTFSLSVHTLTLAPVSCTHKKIERTDEKLIITKSLAWIRNL